MQSISFNKTTKEITIRNDRVIAEEMLGKITEICNLLFIDSSEFDEEKAFDHIFEYIKKYKRILYSQISNTVYACFDKHTAEEASNKLGTMISNIEKILAYTDSPQYRNLKRDAKQSGNIKIYEDAEKALIKIWDHINLAQTQYSGLKQTDEEYKKKFDESITPFKEELVKEMNAQLLTMIGIFTALAFLIFGGISSLDSIFSNQALPLLKVIVVGCVWGFCIFNLVFVFLFCVGKMTGLDFKSNKEPNANIVQKYPIVWWTDLIILTILSGSLWAYYVRKENMDSWFKVWCQKSPQFAMWLGFGVIAGVFLAMVIILLKSTWRKGE